MNVIANFRLSKAEGAVPLDTDGALGAATAAATADGNLAVDHEADEMETAKGAVIGEKRTWKGGRRNAWRRLIR